MVNNKTYNNVVNTLLRLGEFHEQISTTSVGDIYDLNLEKMEKFPLMHINPTSVTTGDSQLTYNFQIFIMDMVSEKSAWQTTQQAALTKLVNTKNNEQEVFNQTLAICTDIIGMLRHSSRQSLNGVNDINQPIYFTQDQFTIEPFQERFDNLCCGYVFNLGVLVQNDFQTCDIPVNTRGAGY
jgi:predicted ATP-dependent protease